MTSAATELVHLEIAAGVATLTLDSPANRNALSTQLREELLRHLRDCAQDTEVRVLVLTHTGTVFCSGMDLREAEGAAPDEQGVNEFPEILQTIWQHPKPVIARVAGTARAGGIGIIAACDLAVAGASTTFAFSEVRIGVVPAVISVTVLPRVQPRAAQELFLTGETFDAERAAQIGLLTAAVPDDDLDAAVARYVAALAKGGPRALAATKVMLSARNGHMAEEFSEKSTLSASFFASEEAQEGMAAFGEKRPPAWVPSDG
ncbi:enoyl-CoA hydratase family protein [Rhodococcus sp. X156]|uniref:enoyl-CoA hydratase family protein n=1 Tax=Rhodococcus sp. X156 TaxID=2499145 RepID=UPI000FD97BDD|nr:enoyl-CoA hydratase family protein [Rhodococcus sp. X156]